jgi:EAL domain-containing protein (putative c-di-GMP-specific phosphodiesterase class I)
MEATQRHSNTLENLRRLGTKIAIDDFGTGYSSLKYLTTYPVNRLKLAQEFVFRVTVDYRNAAVVRATIRLAHELGLDVIAEGVETETQMRFLIGAGCEQAQGYYFSRPVKADQATALLRAGRIEPSTRPIRRWHITQIEASHRRRETRRGGGGRAWSGVGRHDRSAPCRKASPWA